MNWREEFKPLLWILAVFLLAYFMPLDSTVFRQAVFSALDLLNWYAREHVLLCLVPAFFIAGVIAVFISQATVIKYFGSQAKKWVAYSVASVSGAVLAVCSCTILPLFAGIYKRGAGIGPATAFLYSGPAVNILAIILTARILGWDLGLARVIGAVAFAVIIGLIMQRIYRKEETDSPSANFTLPQEDSPRPLRHTVFHFFTLVFILIFATWGKPDSEPGVLTFLYANKWLFTAFFGLLLAFSLVYILKLNKWHVSLAVAAVALVYLLVPGSPLTVFVAAVIALTVLLTFSRGEGQEWLSETWGFAKQILPLLAAGVLVAGFLLGSPEGGSGIIPNKWISGLVGGNSLAANFFASFVGAFMYFATMTEIPILQGLLSAGMGKGPALALLLAGPALSLPNMLVIRGVIGTRKTVVYVSLVIAMSTTSGFIFGFFF